MSPILVTSSLAKSAASNLSKKFGKAVVERWTRYRAECFFEGFAAALDEETVVGTQTEKVDGLLDRILEDDTKSEALFDAYRRVCFSKSKTLGPRIIGLLTGRLVRAGRMADSSEESIFAAAELLSDGEFIEFMKSYHDYRTKAKGDKGPNAEQRMLGESVIIRWSQESSKSGRFGTSELDIGPMDWEQSLGIWAGKLKQCGLLMDRVQQSHETPHNAFADDGGRC